MLHWLGCIICCIGEFVTFIAEVKLMGLDLIGIVSFIFLVPFLKKNIR